MLLSMTLALVFTFPTLVHASDTEVTGVLCVNIAGGWGTGIAVEFTPGLAMGTYWNPIDTSKLELRNAKGQIVAITLAETVGDQIAINRGLGYGYYGWTLTIKAGFQVIRTDAAVSYPGIVVTEKTFIFLGSVETGGYWTEYVAPTDLSVDDNAVELQIGAGNHQIVPTITPVGSNAVLMYESADPAIAAVSATGEISAVAEGNTTVTVFAGTQTETITVAVAAAAAAQNGILVTNPDKTIHTYLGDDVDWADLTAVQVFEGGATGAAIVITAEKISGTYDKNTVGEYILTLTDGVFTDTFTVSVDALPVTEVTGVGCFNIAGGYGLGIAVEFTPGLAMGTYWNPINTSLLELRDDKGNLVPITIAETVGDQIAINRSSGYNYYGWTLTVKSGFRVIRTDDGTKYNFAVGTEVTYIFLGSEVDGGYWTAYVAPTDLSVDDNALDLEVGGANHQIVPTITPVGSNAVILYESADPAIASVSASGLISPVSEGSTTITVFVGNQSEVITVEVAAATAPQTDIVITTPDKTIHTFKGFDYDLSLLTALEYYEGGGTGAAIVITAEKITGTFDKNTVGEYTLTLTDGAFSDTFTVVVDEIPAIEPHGTVAGFDFGNNSGWGQFYTVFNTPDFSHYLNLHGDALQQVLDHVTVAGSHEVVYYVKNLGGGRYEFWFTAGFTVQAGDKVVLEAGMGLWQYEGGTIDGNHEGSGGTFVIVGELKFDVTYVYNGSAWEVWTADPTEFDLTSEVSFVSLGATLSLEWAVTPVGTYGTPVFSSSDEDIATVDEFGVVTGLAEGLVTITATLGSLEETIEITVTPALDITGIELLETYIVYYVPLNAETFTPNLSSARLIFEGGSFSPAFALNAADVELAVLDTSVAGEFDLLVTITYDGIEYETTIPVRVYEYVNQRVTEVAIVDWFIYSVFIQMPNTSANEANITNGALMPGTLEHLVYERADGTIITMQGFYMLGANLAIFPSFLYDNGNVVVTALNYNEYYLEGDMITLQAGMPLYRWTGAMIATETDNHAMDPGTGEVVIDGYIAETIQYRYNGNVWVVYVEYTDIEADDTTIDMQIGENKTTGVTRIPDNATTGIFTYESSDPTIVAVTENGILQALKAGTVTITVTLADASRPADTKTVTLTVTVTDYIVGIHFADPAELKQNKELDLSDLEARYEWRSGTIGEVVDLTGAVVTGLDASLLGEQTVVVRITVGSTQYTGELVVNVVKNNTPLIVGLSAGLGSVTAIVGGLLYFLVIKKKKI